ncbi:MAG TPA: protease inhibitor I42 family protein, partial [Candidatus Limnocylindrales bacterium]
ADAGVAALGTAPSPVASSDNATSRVEQGPSSVVGAPTATTFLLKAAHAGDATVTLSYSRPWAGGEKDVWTYTLHVTVN